MSAEEPRYFSKIPAVWVINLTLNRNLGLDLNPRYFSKIPAVWVINLSFLVMIVPAMLWAAKRDDEEVQLVELLVAGRRIEECHPHLHLNL